MSKINQSELALKEGEVLAENNHKYVEANGDIIEMKYCPHCKEWHLLTDFHSSSSSSDGLQSWCKDCLNEYGRQRTAMKKSSVQAAEDSTASLEQEQDIEETSFDKVIKTSFDKVISLLSDIQLRDEERCKEIVQLKSEVKSLKEKSVDLESLSEREIEIVLKSNKVAPRLLFEAIARQDDRYTFYAIDKVTGLTSTIRLEKAVA